MVSNPFIKIIERGSTGIIQLNRPKALNAVTTEMIEFVYEVLKRFEREKDIVVFKGLEKVFCAGGDVKQMLLDPVQVSFDGCISSFRTIDLISRYKKPYGALVDGLAMGGAAFFFMSAKYRVATERTSFSMPETAIGYFNDAGASFFLPRIENNFGIYMGMTGTAAKGFDMKKLKLATHFVQSSKMNDLEKALIECKTHDEVAKVLDAFETIQTTTVTELDSIMPRVKKCFGGATVEEIYENLRADGSEWAMKTIKTLNRMSPTSLKVTHRAMILGRDMTLRECLTMEFRVVGNHLLGSDMQEGIRAAVVEKNHKPKWNPPTLQEVTEEHVARFFKALPNGEEMTFESELSCKL